MNWLVKRLWRLPAVFVLAVLLSFLPRAVFAQTKSVSPFAAPWPLVHTSQFQGPTRDVQFTFANPNGGPTAVRIVNASLLKGITEIFGGVFRPTENQVLLLAFIDRIQFPQSLIITYTNTRNVPTISAFAIQPANERDRKVANEAYTSYVESRVKGLPAIDLRYGLGQQRRHSHPLAFIKNLLLAPVSGRNQPQPRPTQYAVRPSPSPTPQPPAPPQPTPRIEPQIPPASTPCAECEVIRIHCGTMPDSSSVPAASRSRSALSLLPGDPYGDCSGGMFVQRFEGANYCELCVGNSEVAIYMQEKGLCGALITREQFKDLYHSMRNGIHGILDRAQNGLSGMDLIEVLRFVLFYLDENCTLSDEYYHIVNKYWCLHAGVCDERLSSQDHLRCLESPLFEGIVRRILDILNNDNRFRRPNELREERQKLRDTIEAHVCSNRFGLAVYSEVEECICCQSRRGPITMENCKDCLTPYCKHPHQTRRRPRQSNSGLPLKCEKYHKDISDTICKSFSDENLSTHACPAYVKDHRNKRFTNFEAPCTTNCLTCSSAPAPEAPEQQCSCLAPSNLSSYAWGQVIQGECRRNGNPCGSATCRGRFDGQGRWEVSEPCKSTEPL